MDVIGGGELGAREGRSEQRVVGEQINLAWQPVGRVIDRFFGRGIEERDLRAGQERMREVAGELLASKGGHVRLEHRARARRTPVDRGARC